MHTCESVSSHIAVPRKPPSRLEAENVALLSRVRSGPDLVASVRFRVEQRLFGLGFARAAAARAWYRRYEWTQMYRRLGRVGTVLALVKRPARLAREALRAVEEHGPAVRASHGTSLWTQRVQIFWLGLRRGLDPESYYRFWLFKPERRRVAHLYIQQHEAGLLYRVLAVREAMHDFYIADDKRRFEDWCREHSLPSVRTVAELDDGRIVTTRAQALPLPDRDLFSKPIDSYGGAGAKQWKYMGRGTWQSKEGGTHDGAGLIAALSAQSRDGGILLQECIENDARVAHLSSGALCTARIITIRPPEGAPELVSAVYRMPTGASSTDNFSIAGLAAPIDLQTGRLGHAVRSDPRLVIAQVLEHPDTAAPIAGNCLPWWREATDLVLTAHSRLRSMACVGWDVALTPAGPVLVEANWAPGARLAQAPSGIPLGATNFMRYLDAHMRRSFSRRPLAVSRSRSGQPPTANGLRIS